MLFNHWDEKKGLQDMHNWYFELLADSQRVFAKTCNTRYGSHGVAATQLICQKDAYILFVEQFVRLSKSRPGMNNMEANFVKGMRCVSTVTELCAYAIYSQTLELIVMKLVRQKRGPDGRFQCYTSLGWLIERIKVFCCRVLADPCMLLHRNDHTLDTYPPTLDGTPWMEPELFPAIERLRDRDELPHLALAVRRMFDYALEWWIRFTADYHEGGLVAGLTDGDRAEVFAEPTTDRVEGKNGDTRKAGRARPNESELVRNARSMARDNDPTDYWEHVLGAVRSPFLRREARTMIGMGLEKKRRKRVADARASSVAKKEAKERKRVADLAAKLAKENAAFADPNWKLEVVVDDIVVLKARGKPWLELQLLWHRKHALKDAEKIASKTALKNNTLRAEELSRLIRGRKAVVEASSELTTLSTPKPTDEGFQQSDQQEVGDDGWQTEGEDEEMTWDEEMDEELAQI
jgi:hypothetical protein